MKEIRNIGIFAHVDAGKTTLSEQILSLAGAIRKTGSVDSGTAYTDNLPVERRRGISVKATCVSFDYNGVQINLIDTPGHVDFSAEIERSLWALDSAILVVCAVEGVSPQTEVLFEAMKKQNIPVIFFINKTDREGADAQKVLSQIKRLLSSNAVITTDTDAVTELVCDNFDTLLEKYLNGEQLPLNLLDEKLKELTAECKAYPVLCGSALKNEGVKELLDSVIKYFPNSKSENTLCGVAFAVVWDKNLGKGVWIRLFGGTLENRETITFNKGTDPVTGEDKIIQNKITQIHDAKFNPIGKISSGEIGVVYGLSDVLVGQVIGNADCLERKIQSGILKTPLVTVQVIPDNPEKMQDLRRACDILSSEDPLLEVQYIRAFNELHLKVMGTIQLEIIEEILKTRFDISVSFGTPAIIYKETVSSPCVGFISYTMPKPC